MTDGANRSRPSPAPIGVTLWVIYSAAMAVAGWVLSAVYQLNARGYACFLILCLVVLVICRRGQMVTKIERARFRRTLHRCKQPLPLAYLILASLSLLGALMYLPVNYDALAYRVPRVLHWLAHGEWHWVHTSFPRLNVRACGYEWVMAPLLALTHTTRWLFLPSIISFLLLPGLLFSVFRRFGIKRRIAWHWMWILPAGFCYVAQAGSIGNDLFGAVYMLAAFDFALRLRESRSSRDFWLFLLATALTTGAKASNFPMLLPLFLLFCPQWRMLFIKPVRNFFVIAVAATASFLPTAICNLKYCHDWTGMSLEGPMQPAILQLIYNSVNLVLLNFMPPAFPFTSQWEHFLKARPFLSDIAVGSFGMPELAGEEDAGLGIGLMLLLVAGLLFAKWVAKSPSDFPAPTVAGGAETSRCLVPSLMRDGDGAARRPYLGSGYWKFVLWSPFISVLVYGLKAQAVNSATRLLTPYYAILIVPFLLFFFHERVFKQRWWKMLVALAFAMSIGVVVMTPGRPLWPAQTILGKLADSHPSSALLKRAKSVYQLYRERPHVFAPLAAALPKDETVFGFLTFDDPETSLWWPLGSRRIEHVAQTDTLADLESRGIKYVIAPAYCGGLATPVDELIHRYDAKIYAKVPLMIRSNPGLMDWYILKVGDTSPP